MAEAIAAVDPADCGYASKALELLSSTVEAVDSLIRAGHDPKSTDLFEDCGELSAYCRECLDEPHRSRACLLENELKVVESQGTGELLQAAEEQLRHFAESDLNKSIEYQRCRGRLLAATGRFAEAAQTWSGSSRLLPRQDRGISDTAAAVAGRIR